MLPQIYPMKVRALLYQSTCKMIAMSVKMLLFQVGLISLMMGQVARLSGHSVPSAGIGWSENGDQNLRVWTYLTFPPTSLLMLMISSFNSKEFRPTCQKA